MNVFLKPANMPQHPLRHIFMQKPEGDRLPVSCCATL